MPLVIRATDDLGSLLGARGTLHPARPPRLLIRVARMPDAEAKAWEWRLESLRQECGCSAGVLAVCGFIILSVAYALSDSALAAAGPEVLLLAGGVFIVGLAASAVLGKLIGLRVAARRFRRTCRQLRERLRLLEA